jgi:transcriptional regulator with XRE-family HTH domain
MDINQQKILLRNRKLGVLLLDARQTTRCTPQEFADAMGISLDQYETYETGVGAPSLPELEALAYTLSIPLEQFWGNHLLKDQTAQAEIGKDERLRKIRNRLIGTRLRQERNQVNLTIEDLAFRTGLTVEEIEGYESGDLPIPIPHLEIFAREMNIPLDEFHDQHGPVGQWRSKQDAHAQFDDLSPDLKAFICQPINRPYLELAMRLSGLPVEKLRSVAEGLLEITF